MDDVHGDAVLSEKPISGAITWLAILEYNHHLRIYTCNEEETILQVGDSKLDFNHPPGALSIWWQSGGRNVRVWPRFRSGLIPGGL